MNASLALALLVKLTTTAISTGLLWLLAIASAQATSPPALSFELEAAPSVAVDSTDTVRAEVSPPPTPDRPADKAPLSIPPSATDAPIGTGHELAELPPPPSQIATAPPPTTTAPVAPVAPPEPEPVHMTTLADAGGLSFQLRDVPRQLVNLFTGGSDSEAQPQPIPDTAALPDALMPLFVGGAQSLVAIAVGSAEGTRTPAGDITPAYYGHVDPGNGVWNLGSFSYQHGAKSPEEADQRQLARLQQQATRLWRDAEHRGLQLSLEEWVNAIDLANQAPEAALDSGGYLDRLQESRRLNLAGAEAIAWARTRSYIDPDTQQWNAPGLGNTLASIMTDQERRVRAIARALDENATSISQYEEAITDRLLSMEVR
ncbi:hypothetical protein [Vacuolonema iberomarrocanum]|uniref:hypothetical protein n=1 Tax=Vacuolonema iberomarrocanum TaxID=3454632 RepID=UPI0019E84F0A|nr:hypothetical protein [filamentous cyanobacterium LEGE 07170]